MPPPSLLVLASRAEHCQKRLDLRIRIFYFIFNNKRFLSTNKPLLNRVKFDLKIGDVAAIQRWYK